MSIYKTPGQFIQALLNERGWSQRILAVVLEMDEPALNKIIGGKKVLDGKLAIALSEVFGVEANTFLSLQKEYELAMARVMVPENPERGIRASLFASLPIPEMIKRGWLNVENIKDFSKIEEELLRFFETKSMKDLKILPHAAKKTNPLDGVTPIQMAWVQRVKSIAETMLVAKYSPEAIKSALPKLRELLVSEVATRKVSRILAECGIRFVIVESLKGTKIDGVSLWLDDNSPVIGMSLRYDRIDNFWFVLRHELEHIIQGHGKTQPMIDVNLQAETKDEERSIPQEELAANLAAVEFCVPQKQFRSFLSRKYPFFYSRDIIGFAKTVNTHPGLVAGQLRHHLGAYNRFTDHLAKIRTIVAKESIVDGWGDMAPIN